MTVAVTCEYEYLTLFYCYRTAMNAENAQLTEPIHESYNNDINE